MVQTCIVIDCDSKWYPGCTTTFHSFPKSPFHRNVWLATLQLKNHFYESAKVCGKHFLKSDYLHGNRLRITACPSIYPVDLSELHSTEDLSQASGVVFQNAPTSSHVVQATSSVSFSSSFVLQAITSSCSNILSDSSPPRKKTRLQELLELESEGPGTSRKQPSIKTIPCGTSDDDLADDVDVDEEIRYIRTRVDALEQQSKDYDKIFNEFGETVTSRLKSLPIESALRLHKRLETVIEKFFSSLPDPAETNDSSNLEEFLSFKKKGKTSEKGSSTNKQSSKQASKAFSSDQTIQVKAKSATTSSDTKSKAGNVTFTPNRLAKANEDYNLPVSAPVAKTSAGNGSSVSYGINPGSKSISVSTTKTASIKNIKRPFFENPSSEIGEPVKLARLDDDEEEIVIQLEEDEYIVKTEYDSDHDDFDDPLQFTG